MILHTKYQGYRPCGFRQEDFFNVAPYRERSGSVVECLTRDRGAAPHWRHCVLVLEQDTFILA